jgi:hypothetical protein
MLINERILRKRKVADRVRSVVAQCRWRVAPSQGKLEYIPRDLSILKEPISNMKAYHNRCVRVLLDSART